METEIDEGQQTRAENAWAYFGCKTLEEYNDLYLKIDVLLLADVFENFREICISTYIQDLVWYYTAPKISVDCNVENYMANLELPSGYNMLLFYEKCKTFLLYSLFSSNILIYMYTRWTSTGEYALC